MDVMIVQTVRVMPSERLRVSPVSFRAHGEPQEILGPVDELHYKLTDLGKLVVKHLTRAEI